MAYLNFSQKDVVVNKRDSVTRARLAKALKSGIEIFCCDWNRVGPSPFVVQDLIKMSHEGFIETYIFDSYKSNMDSVYHVIPSAKAIAIDRESASEHLRDTLDFMLNSYDCFVINNSGNEFVFEPRLMTTFGLDHKPIHVGLMK